MQMLLREFASGDLKRLIINMPPVILRVSLKPTFRLGSRQVPRKENHSDCHTAEGSRLWGKVRNIVNTRITKQSFQPSSLSDSKAQDGDTNKGGDYFAMVLAAGKRVRRRCSDHAIHISDKKHAWKSLRCMTGCEWVPSAHAAVCSGWCNCSCYDRWLNGTNRADFRQSIKEKVKSGRLLELPALLRLELRFCLVLEES